MQYSWLIACVFLLVGLDACGGPNTEAKSNVSLPILGTRDVSNSGDTIYHTIPDFTFVDQEGDTINRSDFEGKVYVADFFFTSCPTICPVMTRNMKEYLYDSLRSRPDVLLLSHSIDPRHDSVAVLKRYAAKAEVPDNKIWHFVTGERTELYDIARSYFENATEDANAPGGFLHSGYFYLIDREGRVRGFYNGTEIEAVRELLGDIDRLRRE